MHRRRYFSERPVYLGTLPSLTPPRESGATTAVIRQVAITDLGKVPAERPHPKAATHAAAAHCGRSVARGFRASWRQGDGVACVLRPTVVVDWCGRAPACYQHLRDEPPAASGPAPAGATATLPAPTCGIPCRSVTARGGRLARLRGRRPHSRSVTGCPRRLAAERSIVNGSHEVLHSVTRESGDRQHQVTQRCTRRLDLYFDVVPQTIEAIHRFAFGQVGEVATQHRRDLAEGPPCGWPPQPG